MTSRRRQSRTQRIELVVQPLLSHFAVGHQPAAMPHRGTQRLHRALLTVPSTATLTCHVRQRRAVPVVSLEPARTQLRTSRFGLRRREQPDRARMAAFQFSDPGSVQTARRLDRDHRRVRPMFVSARSSWAMPSRETDKDIGAASIPEPLLIHTRWNALPGSTATITVDGSSAIPNTDMSSLL